MNLIAWTLALAVLAAPAPAGKPEIRLGELAPAVLEADYRGDRAALARLDAELAALDAGALDDYREYWRGFARLAPGPERLQRDATAGGSRPRTWRRRSRVFGRLSKGGPTGLKRGSPW